MRETTNDIVKELVVLSEEAENIGMSKIAADLLIIAKEFKRNKMPIKELWATTQNFYKESVNGGKIIKEAQAFTDIQVDLSDIKNGLSQISKWFNTIQNAFTTKAQYLQQHPKTQKFMQGLGNIWTQVTQLQQNTNAQLDQINKSTIQMEQQMDQELVPNSMMINGKSYKIEFIDDPSSPGYQMATVNVNGRQYEVQEDDSGNRSLKPMDQMQSVEQSQPQQQQQPETAASGQTPRLPDSVVAEASTLTAEQIDKILERLKVASNSSIVKVAMGLQTPKNIEWYIRQNKNNPQAIAALKQLLESKKLAAIGFSVGQQVKADQYGNMLYIVGPDASGKNIMLSKELNGKVIRQIGKDKLLELQKATPTSMPTTADSTVKSFNLSKYLKIAKKI